MLANSFLTDIFRLSLLLQFAFILIRDITAEQCTVPSKLQNLKKVNILGNFFFINIGNWNADFGQI